MSSLSTWTTSGQQLAPPDLVDGQTLRGRAAVVGAVVAALAADDQRALGVTGLHLRDPSQLHGGVDRLRSRLAEEDACVGDRRHRHQQLGELVGARVGERVEAGVRLELDDLAGDGVGHLRRGRVRSRSTRGSPSRRGTRCRRRPRRRQPSPRTSEMNDSRAGAAKGCRNGPVTCRDRSAPSGSSPKRRGNVSGTSPALDLPTSLASGSGGRLEW